MSEFIRDLLLTTGTTLLALGLRKRSADRQVARVVPTLGPGQVGLGLGGSF